MGSVGQSPYRSLSAFTPCYPGWADASPWVIAVSQKVQWEQLGLLMEVAPASAFSLNHV